MGYITLTFTCKAGLTDRFDVNWTKDNFTFNILFLSVSLNENLTKLHFRANAAVRDYIHNV